MPKKNYNQPAFWEQKYKTTTCQAYEWIQKPQLIFKKIADHVTYQQMKKVLQIGCGTSKFLSKLVKQIQARGTSVETTSIDFSKYLIKSLRDDRNKKTQSNYICVDVREMNKSLNSEKFDYIFDKGCIDCLFCYDSFMKEVIKALRQCYNALNQNGKLVIISHGKPKHRVYLFGNKLVPFDVQYLKLQQKKDMKQNREVYIYICSKKKQAQKNQQDGEVLSEGQKSDDQHEKKELEQKKKKQKQNQQKKKKEAKQKQEKQNQNKNKGNFILEEQKIKKRKTGKQEDAPFILQQPNQSKKQNRNTKKNNKKEEAPFILQQDNQEAQFILQENNKQDQNQEQDENGQQDQKQVEQDNDENNNEDGNEQKEQQGQNSQKNQQQRKQAQYENDFQQV